MSGHGGSLLCKAETCALHSSGSIAFHCDIRLLRRFSLHVILLSYLYSLVQTKLIDLFWQLALSLNSISCTCGYLTLETPILFSMWKPFYFWVALCCRLKINAFLIFDIVVTQIGCLVALVGCITFELGYSTKASSRLCIKIRLCLYLEPNYFV